MVCRRKRLRRRLRVRVLVLTVPKRKSSALTRNFGKELSSFLKSTTKTLVKVHIPRTITRCCVYRPSFNLGSSTSRLRHSVRNLSSKPTMSFAHLPEVPGTDPKRYALDAFRIAASVHLAKSLAIPLETAFAGVDLGKGKNDFTVAVPRFRLKAKPADLVAKVVEEVRYLRRCPSTIL